MSNFRVHNDLEVLGTTGTINADTITTNTATQTLTNKTLTTPIITSISNGGTITVPSGTHTLVGADTNDTLTNKTIVVANNTVTTAASGNLSSTELNAALGELQSDIDTRATKALDNLTSVAINTSLLPGTDNLINVGSSSKTFASSFIRSLKNPSGTTLIDLSGSNVAVTGRITGVTDPVGAQDVATKTYVDSLSNGLSWKHPVRAATTVAGTLATDFANGSVIDGITLATNDRILIKNQATGSENGIYTVNASGAPTRATDMNTDPQADAAAVFVTSGTVNGDKGFVQTTDSTTIGTTALVFVQFSNVLYTASGQGIVLSGGNQFSLQIDGSTLSQSGSGVKIATGGVTNTEVATGIDAAKISSGVVSNTEFDYLDGVTSAIQTQLNTKATKALDNLASTAVNVTVSPGTDNSINLGSSSKRWATVNAVGLFGGTSGARINLGAGFNPGTMVDTASAISLDFDARKLYKTDGTTVMLDYSGTNIDVNTRKITSVANPTNDQDAATKAYVDSLSTSVVGDITDTQFNFTNNPTGTITGFKFANASVRGFSAQVSLARIGTANLYETFTINGIQKATNSWTISVTSTGDSSGVTFSIAGDGTFGQVSYTSTSNPGSTSEKMRFRARVNSLET